MCIAIYENKLNEKYTEWKFLVYFIGQFKVFKQQIHIFRVIPIKYKIKKMIFEKYKIAHL